MRRRLAITLLAVAGWAAPALSDTFGPPFGANSYTASIDTVQSVEDADDYVAPLLAGETLTVTVTAAKNAPLFPALSLVTPDGAVTALTPPTVVEKKLGKVVSLSRFPISATGRWTVRVSGKSGTQGGYTIAFSVAAAKAAKPVKLHFGGADPLTRDVALQGLDGALLGVTVKWPKTQAPVHIRAVKDPSGAESSTGAPPTEKKGSATLTRRTLHQGAGTYTVTLAVDSGEVDCTVATTVAPQSRPKSKKAVVLSAVEPFLDARATPIRGDGALTAHLTGAQFPTAPAPQVFFGGAPGTGVVVATDGKSLDVVAPAGAADAVVDVAVVQADGQAAVRPGYFVYVPLPTITSLKKLSGQITAGESTAGGTPLTLTGTGFLTGQAVRFGTVAAVGVTVVDSSHLSVTTPPATAGIVAVAVEDEFARTVISPSPFEFKDPPTLAASPYAPAFAPTAGGSTITITGAHFESTDQLRFAGTDRTSTFVSSTTRRFVSPAGSAGVYSVLIVDRLGLVAPGPNFEIKDPPTFASSPYSQAFGPTTGGTTVTITGTNFESTDQLRFNGVNLTSTFVNSTTRRFVSPAIAAGIYSVDIVDRFGVVVSGPTFEVKVIPTFASTPYSPAYAPTAGGTTVTITGTGFESTDQLRFNGANRASTFVNSTTRTFTTPTIAAGSYSVQIVDRVGIVVSGPFFEIKDPPAFGLSPYSPAFAPTAGGTTVTITGTGFESTDQLRFNGVNRNSTFVTSTIRQFTTPAVAAGTYSVQLVDRLGAVANGPSFEVKDPPTFASSPYSPTFAQTAGGTTVTITGAGFESTDQLLFNGAVRTSTFVNGTTRRFNTPAIAAGVYSVALVDRFSVTTTGPTFEIKDPPAFSSSPYSPAYGAVAGGTTVTITGTGFESTDQLRINGTIRTSTFVNSTTRRFSSPALAAGFYSVQLTDRLGLVGTGPNFEVRAGPSISSVQATAGPILDASRIAAGGGATIQVTGARFASDTAVSLGGTAVTATSQSSTQLQFTAPAGTFGPTSLVVADAAGQTSASTALSYVGFGDETANRQPGASAVDNYLAARGAVGDLDNDGAADDVVITANAYGTYYYNYTTYTFTYYPPFGSRLDQTRVLFANSGALTDATSSNFPAASYGGDVFRANAVAIGDLDGDAVQDIVIASTPVYVYNYATYTSYAFEARVFINNGSGTFTQSASAPLVRTTYVTCTDMYGATYNVFNPGYTYGSATALAVGDLDGDGDAEVVMTTDHSRTGHVFINPSYVTFTPGAYYSAYASHYYSSGYSGYGTSYYSSATLIFDNRGSSGFEDVTFPRMPLCGTPNSYSPALLGRDVKLGDVDSDGSLDIVVAWDNPTTTTPYGNSYTAQYYGNFDIARVATHVLINDGSGFFTDQTSSWLPAGSSPEFWQAGRVELVDLDGDGSNDLVLLHAHLLDGSTTSLSSLRILQNQGAGLGFVDVTASALPSVPLSGTADDNLRGNALLVRDVDGDGNLDIVISTTDALVDGNGSPVRRTRLLRGDGALHFTLANDFLPPPSVDTGEATDLMLGDVSGTGTQSLILLSETPPSASTNSERLRVFDWK